MSLLDIRGTGLLPSLTRLALFLVQVVLIELKSVTFRLSLKRCLILSFLIIFLPCLMVWNHIGFWLDDTLFPDWRNQTIDSPLFIVGNARSGTTWLHQLISHDTESFSTFKSWEIIFAVSITWKRLFHLLYAVDAVLLRGLVYSVLSWIESNTVSHVKVHPIGLQKVEEDEWLMVHIAMSQLLTLLFPLGVDVIIDLVMFDFEPKLSDEVRRNVFRFYRECIQRHLYYHAHYTRLNNTSKGKVVFLSKNPAFTLRLETLYETFPEARVICLLRNPVQSIPSMISYISMVWHVFASPTLKYPQASSLLGFCQAHYMYPLQVLKNRPEHQWSFLSYHTLLESLEDTVIQVLNKLYPYGGTDGLFIEGLTLHRHQFDYIGERTENCDANGSVARYAEDLRLFLREEQIKSRTFVGFHAHSVEQCCDGMTEDEVSHMYTSLSADANGLVDS